MEANDGSEGGGVSERTLERYKRLARGKWGIIVAEATSVTKDYLARKNSLVLIRENLDGFKRLVEAFKTIDGQSLLFFQITHTGSLGNADSRKAAVYPHSEEDLRCFTSDELEEIRKQFVESALLAEEAGADGIDYKLCHGYLGAEIIRPANMREDGWGGNFENRTRLLREGMREIKSRLKTRDFVLGSRISMYEGIRGGCGTGGPDELIEDLCEMRQVIGLMESLGMHYVNVSAGVPGPSTELIRPTKSSMQLAFQQFRYAKEAREATGSLRVIGSAYSFFRKEAPFYAAENVQKGYTDFAGFGRQSFADPLYPVKLMEGEPVNYCTLCSRCARLMMSQENAGCVVYDEYYRDLLKRLENKAF
jgi:2,4-dienoyl-CoA reductase-like NADH-dependent reductase (Old Yellow Enzyme family)